ncbi:hypothetical protein [Paenisporosarcina cavernae]|uniref:Uncharacterized protein n=1 Tax=Paenisporosarcina cavernae TaxID=2320858 RepID=A0A385YPG2_9BACL|nr:hypothetical protein [Paenisporosarcina cavernae]AYC28486.1 hypothetical protein D3873_00855 [Paenisporosarcina cavernae]
MKPTDEQLAMWGKTFVPPLDIFFVKEEIVKDLACHLDQVLLMPREEFNEHTSYKQILYANSYEYWNVSEEGTFVIVAHPEWVTSLPHDVLEKLLQLQIELERGLVYPIEIFEDVHLFPLEYIVRWKEKQYVVFQGKMWCQLTSEVKNAALLAIANEWEIVTEQDITIELPDHLNKYANTYATTGGSNCLSSTLYAVRGVEWRLHEWVHPRTFIAGIVRAGYERLSMNEEPYHSGDIIVWENSDGVVQHASYHIKDDLFFNKNGQTFFNAWRIIRGEDLRKVWSDYAAVIYRKVEGS